MFRSNFKRIISAVLCFAMVISCITLPVSAASAGTTAATTTETFFRDGLNYTVKRTTQYVGNRTYSVQVEIAADMYSYDHARVRTASKNGYITIQQDGYYLLELWGGDGGSGQYGMTVLLIPTPEGQGASGGYVYGKVFLRAGQTLAYSVGTNGTESTIFDDGAGGVNGDGGTHGDVGSYTVGAGGGYTAIYLFNEGEFREEYVTDTTFNIPETARLSRYLMIAGGGGGGGAGFTNMIDNGTVGQPDGGAGGNINRGVSMSLLGDQYRVPGYVFSGRNGRSSGTDSSWIGRGGSNVPGTVPDTLMGQFQPTERPNDWTGTANPGAEPGAGGTGNFRGGGGGSGYAGGSGGMMKAQLIASHVGGGGGGSSFIADSVNGQKIQFLDLSENEKQYLSGEHSQPVGSGTGGAVQVTYLGGEMDVFYQEALNNITLSATASQYFDVLEAGSAPVVTANADGTQSVSVSGLSLVPASPNSAGQPATATVFLRAKSDFLGGNVVDMFCNEQVDFLSPNDNATPINLQPAESRSNRYVNVPLSLKVRTLSYTSSQKGKAYQVTSLYENDYADMSASPGSYWECDYIASISGYAVYQNGTQITDTTVAPQETTTYRVELSVVPKYAEDSSVFVGPAVGNPQTVFSNAVISVVAPGTAELNGLNVTGAKNLSYENGAYIFSTVIDQQSKSLPVVGDTETYAPSAASFWTAQEEGWYYVQAWGGDGGSSGSATIINGKKSGSKTTSGASGGSGGYVDAYLYLQKGEMLEVRAGSAGASRSTTAVTIPTGDTNGHAKSTAGGGGSYSYVKLGETYIVIAGGGGGGGESIVYGRTYSNLNGFSGVRNWQGTKGNDVKTTNGTLDTTLSAYSGSSGGSGSIKYGTSLFAIPSGGAGGAGSAGRNYKNGSYGTTQNGHTLSTTAQKYAVETIGSSYTGSNGRIAITLIENSEFMDVQETVKGLETKVAFSRYFDVNTIDLDVGTPYDSRSQVNNVDGSKTVTYTNNTYGQIAQFTYATERATDGSTIVTISNFDYTLNGTYTKTDAGYFIQYAANLTISYNLTPKEGFLGGNDVPVLAYGQIGGVDKDSLPDCGVRVAQGEDFMNLPAANPTDFANVENTVDLVPYLQVQDQTIHLGDSIEKVQLYTFDPPVYGEDAWEDDYAYFVSPGNAVYTPTQTTDYTISASFMPRVPEAQRATIVQSLEAQAYSLSSTVYVEVPVTSQLTNLRYEGEDWTLYGEPFTCAIVPEPGYLLPSEIQVSVGGVSTEEFLYNESMGTIFIDGAHVTGPIEIQAQAAVQTYNIHILYTMYDAEKQIDVMQPEYVISGIYADEVIDWTWLDDMNTRIPAKEGYNYAWTYETADSQRPVTMPANDLWVYGSYEKAQYPITIHYVYGDDGTEAAPSYQGAAVFGESYNITSPIYPDIARKGYLPDQMAVTGTMGTSGVEITVTYQPSTNKLVIIYQKADGTLIDTLEQSMQTNEAYRIDSPVIDGYTADIATVEGVMSGDESESVLVTYTPNIYTVTFDYSSGAYAEATLDAPDTRSVQYDNIYGYNAAEDTFDGLPTAQLAGYTFQGWYKDATLTNPVVEGDKVDILEDITLFAKWERTKFKLTVRYEFLYEEGDFLPEGFDSADAVRATLPDHEEMVEADAVYLVELPHFTGYSAYEDFGLNDQEKVTMLTGIMPSQNMLVIITYEINTYTVRFKDLSGQNVTYSDAATSTVATDNFQNEWKTVYVKHNVAPVYEDTDITPEHATREAYTYTFTGWKNSNTGAVYAGKTPQFPAAWEDHDYYAMYDATENIVAVNYGSKVEYFTNVADAVAFGEENIAAPVTMQMRRNPGNDRKINLNGDTFLFGNTYTGTTAYTMTLELNGCRLMNTLGEPIVNNGASAINLTIQDSGAGGSISVSGSGDVAAVVTNSQTLTLKNAASIEAVSEDGNATALELGADVDTVSMDENAVLKATAAYGKATGISVEGSTQVNASKITASGVDAVGICVENGGALTLTGSKLALAVNADSSATGIHVMAGGTLSNTAAMTKTQSVVSQTDATGILNEGSLNSVNLKMDVTAQGNAYGLHNNGGSITLSGIGTSTDLRATGATGSGFGLYHAAGSAAIGAEEGSKLSSGAFAGSTFGIYAPDGNVYASGNKLYFKGADAAEPIRGVVHTNYVQTDAEKQFEAGYLRLAAEHTITFETNEGSAIAPVIQLFDTDLAPVVTTRRGYDFVSWHKDVELTSSFEYPKTMPDEDLDLYAQWSLNTYEYALDLQFKEITVKFYKTDPTAPTDATKMTLLHEQKLTMDDNVLVVPNEELTYANGSTLYVHSGWYKSTTTSQENHVVLNGDIAQYADENGELILYSGWRNLSSMQDYVEMGTSTVGCFVDATYSTYYYMYYVVPADGNYTLYYRNNGSSSSTGRRRYITVTKYYNSNGTNYSTDLKSRGTVSVSSSYSTLSMSGLKAGNIIVLRAERYSSSYTSATYDTTVYAYVSSTNVDLSAVNDYKAISEIKIEPIDYNVEMGVVALPVADNTGHEDLKFAGWAAEENAPEESWIMELTPEMVDTVPAWQNRQMWQLYSQWTQRLWTAYQSPNRDFSAFTSTDSVTIDSKETVSLRFKAEQMPEAPVSFRFQNGLPSGTLLTLVDRSGAVPVYYTRTVLEAKLQELSATEFVKMGDEGTAFSGLGTDLILQICYANATVSSNSETVSLYAGDMVSEVDTTYNLAVVGSLSTSMEAVAFDYATENTTTMTVPALSGLGLPEDHKVMVRIRWDDLSLAPGTSFSVSGMEATVFDGAYAMVDLGMTVSQFNADMTATLVTRMPTMVQNEFTDKTFYYELCIMPADLDNDQTVFGEEVRTVISVAQEVTVYETPSVSVSSVTYRLANAGETVTVAGISPEDATVYLCQQETDGRMVYTAACASVFADLSVDNDGIVSRTDGALLTDGTFQGTVSDAVQPGTYYLKIVGGDKYEIVPVVIK